MRDIHFEPDYLMNPAGSCLACYGNTKVICTATLEDSVPPFLRDTGKGWVSAEYSMLPGSTNTRKNRNGVKRDGRGVEISRLIARSLRAGVKMDLLGEKSIMVDCDVIQADGGTRTAAISGGWVALYLALEKLADEQVKPGPGYYLYGQLAAVSVGIVDGTIICDLDYSHDSRAEVDMNVVMRDSDYVEIQGTGEKGIFNKEQLNLMLESAEQGIQTIFLAQKKAIS